MHPVSRLAVAALLAQGCALPVHAVGQLADLQVYDRTSGATLAVHEYHGRYYIAGEPGHEYQLSVSSRDAGRILAIGSVDGVNVISGETAAGNRSGYVLSPWENLAISGWRKSLDHVAAFYFTRLPDSYAARTGRPGNVGVIGLAVFREKAPCCAWRDDAWRERDAQAPAAQSAAPAARAEGRFQKDEKLGTGHGRIENSQASYTEFERAASTPDEVVSIYYDSYENLCRQGVISRALQPRPRRANPHRANPFPGGFVPDPS